MRLAFFVCCWLGLTVLAAAAPETKPANNDPIARLEQAKEALQHAEDLCLRRLEETQAYKTAAADLSAKEKELADARRSTNPSDRLGASAAFLRARNAIEKMKASAKQSDPTITEATAALSTAQHEADDFLRAAEADAKRHAYLIKHPIFAKLRARMDAVKSTPDPSRSAGDAYSSYAARATKMVAAVRVLTDYFQLIPSNDWDANEYHELLSDASTLFTRWQSSLSDREKEYPSADALIAAVNSCAHSEDLIPLMHTFSSRSDDFERQSDFDSSASESRAAFECVKRILANRDTAAENVKLTHRLILTRERNIPIVPPTTRP